MTNGTDRILKVITALVILGGAFGSALAAGYKAISEAKEYTDTNVRFLRDEQSQKMDKVQGDVTDMKQDIAIIRTIIEERFGKRRTEVLLPSEP